VLADAELHQRPDVGARAERGAPAAALGAHEAHPPTAGASEVHDHLDALARADQNAGALDRPRHQAGLGGDLDHAYAPGQPDVVRAELRCVQQPQPVALRPDAVVGQHRAVDEHVAAGDAVVG
jgi:hypothetical protein